VETYLIVDKQHVKQRLKPRRQSLRQLVLERRSNTSYSKFDIQRGKEEELNTIIRNQTAENSLIPVASKRLSVEEDSIILDSNRPLPSFRITIDDVNNTQSDKVCRVSLELFFKLNFYNFLNRMKIRFRLATSPTTMSLHITCNFAVRHRWPHCLPPVSLFRIR
jgi:hypothetical protein